MILQKSNTIDLINEALPSCIRVFAIRRVVRSFVPKDQCDWREYEFLLPTYALASVAKSAASASVSDGSSQPATEELSTVPFDPQQRSSELEQLRSRFRLSADTLELLRACLAKYQGTHRFHNFTSGKTAKDASSKRYIISFTSSDPFVAQGIEWVRLTVVGQSFMLHQIRKMVGLVVSVVRNGDDVVLMNQALSTESVRLPMVPGVGLVLNKV